jgi:hypothetical protein
LRFPPQARIEVIITALEHQPTVRSVTKNWILHPDFTPDDYYYNHDTNSDGRLDQWVFQRTQLDRAWDVTQGVDSVVVALIDTGFDWEHPDLDEDIVWINEAEDYSISPAYFIPPGREPSSGNRPMYVPSASNRDTRAGLDSMTPTAPSGITATDTGAWNSPGPSPLRPMVRT